MLPDTSSVLSEPESGLNGGLPQFSIPRMRHIKGSGIDVTGEDVPLFVSSKVNAVVTEEVVVASFTSSNTVVASSISADPVVASSTSADPVVASSTSADTVVASSTSTDTGVVPSTSTDTVVA